MAIPRAAATLTCGCTPPACRPAHTPATTPAAGKTTSSLPPASGIGLFVVQAGHGRTNSPRRPPNRPASSRPSPSGHTPTQRPDLFSPPAMVKRSKPLKNWRNNSTSSTASPVSTGPFPAPSPATAPARRAVDHRLADLKAPQETLAHRAFKVPETNMPRPSTTTARRRCSFKRPAAASPGCAISATVRRSQVRVQPVTPVRTAAPRTRRPRRTARAAARLRAVDIRLGRRHGRSSDAGTPVTALRRPRGPYSANARTAPLICHSLGPVRWNLDHPPQYGVLFTGSAVLTVQWPRR